MNRRENHCRFIFYFVFLLNMSNPQAKPNNPQNPNPNHNNNGIDNLTTPSSLSTDECSNCRSNKRWKLHQLRIRGTFRHLCTTCVLRLHPSSFCPCCFQLHEPTNIPSSTNRLTCYKCSSFTHSHCAPSSAHPSSSYLCPPCASTNFTFFDIDYDPNIRFMDKRLSLVFYCASQIAFASMTKPNVVSLAEHERRAKEAAIARKRARESLQHFRAVVDAHGSGEVFGSVANLGLNKGLDKKPLPVVSALQGKEMFNAFGGSANPKSINGEAMAVNGNVNEKKSKNVIQPEEINILSMDIDQKSVLGSKENVSSK